MTTAALSTTAWACAISMLPSEQLIERIVNCAGVYGWSDAQQ